MSISILRSEVQHSNVLLGLAADARRRCEAFTSAIPNALTYDAIVAILLASSAAESFINELLEEASASASDSGDVRLDRLAWVLQKIEDSRGKTLDKFECAVRVLSDSKPDLGGPPFQDSATLFSIRNAVMHTKRKSVIDFRNQSESSPTPKCLQTLLDRGLARETLFDRQTHWIFSLMTTPVAQWACSTSAALCAHVWNMLADKAFAERVRAPLDRGIVADCNLFPPKQKP